MSAGEKNPAGDSGALICEVCPRHCRLAAGALGACHARRNVDGAVVPEGYGRLTSIALDPVEKKPLARFMPGTYVVSVGGYGCNLRCPFCQNWEISQASEKDVRWRQVSPENLVALTLDARERDGSVCGIAYTYNEPLITWEYVRDCARLAHEAGLVNVLVSNGCVEPAVIDGLEGLLDAANIDLKGFSDAFYDACGGAPGALACVRGTIERLAADARCHLEVTTLVVPGMNDDEDEMDELSGWLASLDGGRGRETITHHVTRFFPRWRLTDRPATPVETVHRLAEVSRRHLAHVLVGNC